MSYAEAEAVLQDALAAHFTTAYVCTETPSDLADHLPCIRVTRFGGAADSIYTFDNAQVDFDCYAASRAAARTLAHDVRTYLHATLEGSKAGGAFIAKVQDIQGPTWTPYDNTSLRRFTYSAEIRLHSLGT
jgi:hypothetical protein